jgi:hypothetical protein
MALLQFRLDQLSELSKVLRPIDHAGRIAFPKDLAVGPNQVGHGPLLEAVLSMVPTVLVPQHRVLEAQLLGVLLDDFQRFLLTPRDFDDDQTLLRVLFVPPDQVVSERRAILSIVEVQPDDLAL